MLRGEWRTSIMFRGIALFLSAAYLFVSLPSFEFHFDHENHHSCTEENEKNPCHRSIVHNDVIHGCDHESHLVKDADQESIHPALLPAYLVKVGEYTNYLPDLVDAKYYEAKTHVSEREWQRNLSDRGPPTGA